MLGMKNYTQEYIDACRSRVDADLSAYGSLVSAANTVSEQTFVTGDFEATFFNNMMLILDYLFVHRLPSTDGKDGNPLNEVRVICDSLLSNNNIMSSGTVSKSSQMRFNKSIKLSPEKSVLKYQVGDEIRLNEADFLLISKAFFAEIERRYL